jgi:hypothetical protein
VYCPILTELRKILKNQGVIMSALTDLQGEVSNIATSVSALVAAVKAAILASAASNNGAVAASDVEAVVAQLSTIQATMDAETAALTPAPAPPAAS